MARIRTKLKNAIRKTWQGGTLAVKVGITRQYNRYEKLRNTLRRLVYAYEDRVEKAGAKLKRLLARTESVVASYQRAMFNK